MNEKETKLIIAAILHDIGKYIEKVMMLGSIVLVDMII